MFSEKILENKCIVRNQFAKLKNNFHFAFPLLPDARHLQVERKILEMKTNENLSLTVHPRAEKYRNRNRQLQAELAGLIADRDELKHGVIPQIAAEYQIKIGVFEWRVFQMDCETRAIIRRIELAQAALNRGEKPCHQNIEREIETEFAEWREKIEQSAREIKRAKLREKLPLLTVAESRELQTIYRKLAFLLHPDITKSSDKRPQKLWRQTAEAYKNGDLQTLRTIRLIIGNEKTEIEFTDNDLSILDILENRQNELKEICEKLLDEISELKSTEPFILHEILDDEAELERRQNFLRDQIADLQEKRLHLTECWAEIMRFAEDRETITAIEEPPNIFEDEDDWAEMIYEL